MEDAALTLKEQKFLDCLLKEQGESRLKELEQLVKEAVKNEETPGSDREYYQQMKKVKMCIRDRVMTLEEIGSRAKAVSRTLNNLGSREKNIGLEEAARALLEGEEEILAANQADYEKAENCGMSKGLLDRLALNPGRIQSMADGLLKVAALDDPVGDCLLYTSRCV